MKLRHRLISWLAFGDAILMNVEFMPTGAIRPKELGGILIHNAEFRASEAVDYGVYLADVIQRRPNAVLVIESLERPVTMSETFVLRGKE